MEIKAVDKKDSKLANFTTAQWQNQWFSWLGQRATSAAQRCKHSLLWLLIR